MGPPFVHQQAGGRCVHTHREKNTEALTCKATDRSCGLVLGPCFNFFQFLTISMRRTVMEAVFLPTCVLSEPDTTPFPSWLTSFLFFFETCCSFLSKRRKLLLLTQKRNRTPGRRRIETTGRQ